MSTPQTEAPRTWLRAERRKLSTRVAWLQHGLSQTADSNTRQLSGGSGGFLCFVHWIPSTLQGYWGPWLLTELTVNQILV